MWPRLADECVAWSGNWGSQFGVSMPRREQEVLGHDCFLCLVYNPPLSHLGLPLSPKLVNYTGSKVDRRPDQLYQGSVDVNYCQYKLPYMDEFPDTFRFGTV